MAANTRTGRAKFARQSRWESIASIVRSGAKRCVAPLAIAGVCAAGACTQHGGDARAAVGAGEGAHARVMLQPCLACDSSHRHRGQCAAGAR